MATKRGADVQLDPTGLGFVGDGSQVASANAPVKATAAQMAKRKVAAGRRPGGGQTRTNTSFNASPAPTPPVVNGNSFQQNGAVGGGLFGQSNFNPPSTGFNFSAPTNNNFQFGGAAASSAPAFGSSSNQDNSSSAGYTGSLFSLPATAPVENRRNSQNGNLWDSDPNRRPNPNFNDNSTPQWASNSPFHSKTPAIDALTGTTAATAGMSQQGSQQMNASGGLFGQAANNAQQTSSPSQAGSVFSTPPFSFGNNTSSAVKPLFGQSQSTSQSSPTVSAPSFAQSMFAPSNQPTSSSNLFASANSGMAASNSTPSFAFTPQKQNSSSTASGLFGSSNTQTSSAPSNPNLFGGFAAGASPAKTPGNVFGGLGASSHAKPTFSFGTSQTPSSAASPGAVQESPMSEDQMQPDHMSPGETRRYNEQQGRPEISAEEERLRAYQQQHQPEGQAREQSQPSTNSNPFSFGGSATRRESSAPPSANIFSSSTSNLQPEPRPSLFANLNTPKASQPQQSLFSKPAQTPQSSQPQANLFSGTAASTSQPPQQNLFSSSTSGAPTSSSQSLFGKSVSQASQVSHSAANTTADSASKPAVSKNLFNTLSAGASQAPQQQSTSLFSSPSKANQGLPAAKPQSSSNLFASNQNSMHKSAPEQMTDSETPELDANVLKSIKVQCITSTPQNYPDGLSEAQKQQFLLGYRMRCLEKGLRLYISHLGKVDVNEASSYYDSARSTIFSIAGVKRSASNAGLYDGGNDQNKRLNMNGPVTNGIGSKAPLFGMPTAEKRKADNERVESPKKSKAGNVSYPSLPESSQTPSSQTSRLFANLTNAANNSATPQPSAATPAKSTTASLFSTTPAHPPPSTANVFGTLSKSDNANSTERSSPFKAFSSSRASSSEPAKTAPPASSTNFLAQFGQKAKLTEAEEKAKRKAEDFDSEDETEEQWEKRDAEEQRKKKEALASAGNLKVPSFGSASSSRSASPAGSVPPTAPAEGFLAQFGKKAQMTEAEEKAKRKIEDFDSEDETEAEWEARDAQEQRKKKQKLLENTNAQGFKVKPSGTSPALSATSGGSTFSQPADAFSTPSTPNMIEHLSQAGSDAEGSKTGDADNEDSYEEGEGEGHEEDDVDYGDEDDSNDADDGAKTPTAAPGRSLFDRIERDANGNPKKHLSGFQAINASKSADEEGADTNQPGAAKRSSSEQPKASPFGSSANIFGASGSTPKANIFGSQTPKTGGSLFSFGKATETNSTSSPKNDNTWKPDSPIKFGNPSATAPAINLTSPSPTKPTEKALGGLFGTPKSGIAAPASTTTTSNFVNPFAHLSNASSPSASPAASVGFDFGSPAALKPSSNNNSLAPTSILASATTSRATTPGMTTGEESTGEDIANHNNEPQLDLASNRSGEEHEDILFDVKAKAYEFASPAEEVDSQPKEWLIRGVGSLRVLKNKETKKVRMVLRAGPTGKVVLNCGLMKGVKYENTTKKSVSFLAVGRPGEKLGKWVLQVGKEPDAAALKNLLEKEKAS